MSTHSTLERTRASLPLDQRRMWDAQIVISHMTDDPSDLVPRRSAYEQLVLPKVCDCTARCDCDPAAYGKWTR